MKKCTCCDKEIRRGTTIHIDYNEDEELIFTICKDCIKDMKNRKFYIVVCLNCGTSAMPDNVTGEDLFIELFENCMFCPITSH